MFGFFKKKNVGAGANGADLASRAVIESVLEHGRYSGFLVRLGSEKSAFVKCADSREELLQFITGVESRIASGDFDDLLPKINYEQLGIARPMGDFGKSSAIRAVFGDDLEPLFKWNGAQVHVSAKATLVNEFKLSSFMVSIEADAENGTYPFRLTAIDTRTNNVAFRYGIEKSPFATCLVGIFADGSRYNFGQIQADMSADDFENWVIPRLIDTVYADQVLTLQEINAFGVRVVAEHLDKVGAQLLTINKDVSKDPQIFALVNGKTAGIIVRTATFPEMGILDKTTEDFYHVLSESMDRGYDLYLAPVGLANANAENDYERKALLRNGSYNVSFSKLELME